MTIEINPLQQMIRETLLRKHTPEQVEAIMSGSGQASSETDSSQDGAAKTPESLQDEYEADGVLVSPDQSFIKPPKANPKTDGIPMCAAGKKGVPNGFLRCSLFGVVEKGERKAREMVKLAAQDGIEIYHSGYELDQDDLDAWATLCHMATIHGTDTLIRFTGSEFLKSLGKQTGKSQYDWLLKCAMRLRAQSIQIKSGRYSYIGGLVRNFYHDEVTGQWVAEIDSAISALFGHGDWTQLEWERRKLIKSHLGRWLLAFFECSKPMGRSARIVYGIDKLHQMSGSQIKEMRSFKYKINRELATISNLTGWLITWEGNNLCVVKDPKAVIAGISK